MKRKQNKSEEPNLDLSLATPAAVDPIIKIPTLEEAVNSELCQAQIEELKLELKRLKLAKAQEEEYMKGESFNFYNYDEAESAEEVDMNNDINTDQYVNFDDMNVDPHKNDM
ncbi:hypothetical protein FXO37_16924 [Capsicum annuum]|nr:hypothetical protein FXO37_16924 [Capsicum annuum]